MAVADVADVDPLAVEPPLYDVVDPDALEALVDHSPDGDTFAGQVAFTHAGCRVRVHGDGRIEVSDAE